jgi:hypothetical protein
MKHTIKKISNTYLLIILVLHPILIQAQNVGIGITTPAAGLHIVSDNGIIAQGTLYTGAVINQTGSGSKFIFYPRKGAIRGGYLDGLGANYWDDASTGKYSIGFGYNTRASGTGSVAIGEYGLASGESSLALGGGGQAIGDYSIVLSSVGSNANAISAIAMGAYSDANADRSIAIGNLISAGFSFLYR